MINYQIEKLKFVSYLMNNDDRVFTFPQLHDLFFEICECEETFNLLFMRLIKTGFLAAIARSNYFEVNVENDFYPPSHIQLRLKKIESLQFWKEETKCIAVNKIINVNLN